MKQIFFTFLLCCALKSSTAQIYLRAQLGADIFAGATESYRFGVRPNDMQATTQFRGRFGGGEFAQVELGVKHNHVEAGFNYTVHGSAIASRTDTTYGANGDTIVTGRTAAFTGLNRLGATFTYYFGEKNFNPFVFGGVQTLLSPRFVMGYGTDTLEHPVNFVHKQYSNVRENYGGGVSVGATIGAGISYSGDPRLRCFLKAGFTFQSWRPKECTWAAFYSPDVQEYYYNIKPDVVVRLNAVTVQFGGVYYFVPKEKREEPEGM